MLIMVVPRLARISLRRRWLSFVATSRRCSHVLGILRKTQSSLGRNLYLFLSPLVCASLSLFPSVSLSQSLSVYLSLSHSIHFTAHLFSFLKIFLDLVIQRLGSGVLVMVSHMILQLSSPMNLLAPPLRSAIEMSPQCIGMWVESTAIFWERVVCMCMYSVYIYIMYTCLSLPSNWSFANYWLWDDHR